MGDDLLKLLEALLEPVDALVGHQAKIINEPVVPRPWPVTPASPQYANSLAPPPFGSRPVGHIQNGRRAAFPGSPPPVPSAPTVLIAKCPLAGRTTLNDGLETRP